MAIAREPLLIEDLAANHSTITANRVYGRPSTLSISSTKTLEDSFLKFNIEFLRYFNLLEDKSTSTITTITSTTIIITKDTKRL